MIYLFVKLILLCYNFYVNLITLISKEGDLIFMKKIILGIEGMTCSACSNSIEKYIRQKKGIESVSVNLVMANVTVEFNENILKVSDIEKFISEIGFKSTGEFDINKEEKQDKRAKLNLIIFGILSVIILYFGMIQMMLPSLAIFNVHKNSITYCVILFALVLPFLFYGFDLLRVGFKNLIHRAPNMDSLVMVGVVSTLCYSIYSFIMICTGHHDYLSSIYIDSIAIVIFFVKLGRFFDISNKKKTRQAVKKLVTITPTHAKLKLKPEFIEIKNNISGDFHLYSEQQSNDFKEVTIDEIKEGDIICAFAGEKIAVDGEIVFGQTHLDERFITGESEYKLKKTGDKVIAGSVCYYGYIEYRAEKIGKNSTISEIVNLVVEASNTKMKISRVADKVSGIFVPSVLVIAFLSFLIYLVCCAEFSYALKTFVSVLVVACPCALGLATPLAVVISEGITAQNGILVKKSEVFETATKVTTVVFDKTGTLTTGKLTIKDMKNYSKLPSEQVLKIACSMERNSSHPISSAFLGDDKCITEDFKTIEGIGIYAKVDGNECYMANSRIFEYLEIENEFESDENEIKKSGCTTIFLVQNSKVLALFGIRDTIKDDAKNIISELKNNNIEVIMLTGDNKTIAEIVASELGIENVIAEVYPKDKTKVIKDLQKQGKIVLMVGDGINDSPALSLANIGVSVYGSTDIASSSADVILLENKLTKILQLLKISSSTVKNIKQNLFWAFLYNSLMIPIAVGALVPLGVAISPMIAGIAMVLSSFCITLNALRLKLIKL